MLAAVAGVLLLGGASAYGDRQISDTILDVENGQLPASNNTVILTGTNAGSTLLFNGANQTIDNLTIVGVPTTNWGSPGTLMVGGPTSGSAYTLTLGSNMLLRGFLNIVERSYPYDAITGTLINNGTINADSSGHLSTLRTSFFTNNNLTEATAGGQLAINHTNFTNNATVLSDNGLVGINSSSTFVNNVAVQAIHGGRINLWASTWSNAAAGTISADGASSQLYLGGAWNNAGTITLTNAATAHLGGTFTLSNLGTINASADSTVAINGLLDNTGTTFDPSHYTGNWRLDDTDTGSGRILGGTLSLVGSNFSVCSGTLDGVTLAGGDLQVNTGAPTVANLTVKNGLTGDQHSINLNGSQMRFYGADQTVDNVKINGTAGSSLWVAAPFYRGDVALTLGAGVYLHGAMSLGTQRNGPATSSRLVNDGTINADQNGQTIYIGNEVFINQGAALASNGGVLQLDSNWRNDGQIHITSGSTFYLGGIFTTAGLGSLDVSSDSTAYVTGNLFNLDGDNLPTTLHLGNYGGNWQLYAGTITGGTLDLRGSNFSVPSGTLDGVKIVGGDLPVTGSLTVQHGLSGDGFSHVKLQGLMVFDGASQSIEKVNVNGAGEYRNMGEIYVGGLGSTGPVTLTVEQDAAITGALTINDQYTPYWPHTGGTPGTLVNNGMIHADWQGHELAINVSNFINNGLAQATHGGTLSINSPAWTNAGTFAVSGASTLNLGGSFTTAGIGSLTTSSDSVVNITGNLDNTSATLRPRDYGCTWGLLGGKITGGTVALDDDQFYVQNGDFDGVTINLGGTTTGSTLTFDNSDGHLVDNVTINGTTATDSGARSYLTFREQWWAYPGLLTLGPSTLVHGALSIRANYGGQMVNNGTIHADQTGQELDISPDLFTNNGALLASNDATLSIYSSAWTSTGTIGISEASTLNLGGNFVTAELAGLSASADSLVNIIGNLDNTGATLSLADHGGVWALSGGSVTGGTLALSDSRFTVRDGALNGVVLSMGGDAGGSALIFDGSNDQTLDNVEVNGSPTKTQGAPSVLQAGGPATGGPLTLTLGQNAVVHGALNINQQPGISGSVINYGTISADQSGQTLAINVDSFANYGTAQAINGGILAINSPHWTNAASLSADGSTLTLNGSWNNFGTIAASNASTVNLGGAWSNAATIDLVASTLNLGGNFTTGGIGTLHANDGTVNLTGSLNNTFSMLSPGNYGGSWNLSGGTITGGWVDLSGQNFAVRSGTLDGVTLLYGDLSVNDGTLVVRNSLAGDGHAINLSGSGAGSVLTFDGADQWIDQVNISGMPTSGLGAASVVQVGGASSTGAVTLTLNPGAMMHGALSINQYPGISGSLVNNGTISADQSGQTLAINVDSFTNCGTAQAISGGTLAINSPNWTNYASLIADGSTLALNGSWNNFGTITASNAGTVNLGGSFDPGSLGILSLASDSTVNLTGTLNNVGNTFSPGGYGASWTMAGGAINGGSLDLGGRNFAVKNGTLDGVTLVNGDLPVNDGTLTIAHGVDGGGNNINLGGSGQGSTLIFDGPAQVVYNVGINGVSTGAPSTIQVASSFVSLSPDVVVHGALNIEGASYLVNQGLISADQAGQTLAINVDNFANSGTAQATGGGTLAINARSWTNVGTISADASTLTLTGSWDNSGTIAARNASTVNLGGSFTTGTIRTLSLASDSTVNLTGEMDNTGDTFSSGAFGGTWNLAGGTINGGMLDGSSANLVVQNGTLAGVTLANGDLSINDGTLTILHGVDGSGHSINLGGSSQGSTLIFDGRVQQAYNVAINGVSTGAPSTIQVASSLVSLSPETVVHGALNIEGASYLVNNGVISADRSGQMLAIKVDNFTNSGQVEAANGGILVIDSPTLTNFSAATGTLTGGTWKATASTLQITGASIVTNAANIVLDGPSSRIVADAGGTDALAPFASNSAGASFTLANGRSLVTAGSFVNDGLLAVSSGSSFAASGDFENHGTTAVASHSLLTVAGNLVNSSSLTVQDSGSVVSVGSNLTNHDTIALFSAGRLEVAGDLQNNGSLIAHDADTVVHVGGLLINDGTISGNGTIEANVVNNGTISPGNSPGTLHIVGNLTSTGTIIMQYGPTGMDQLIVDGGASLTGPLEIQFLDGFTPTDGAQWTMFVGNNLDTSLAFASTTMIGLPEGVHFNLDSSTGAGTFSGAPVPEPALVSLLATATMFLARRRRKLSA